MIHTLYRRATYTFHTPSWVTSYLLLVFLSSSSLQFVFSEQLGFEHQLRSQLLWFEMVSRSIKRQRIENNELQASSNQDQPINHASTKQAKQQGFKWSPDRSSKRRFLKTKTCHIPRAKSFTQHQTASEKETSQPLLDTIPGLLFDFHSMSQTSKPFLFTSTATNRLDIRCHTVQSSQQSKEARTPASYKPLFTVCHGPLVQMPMTSLILTVLNP